MNPDEFFSDAFDLWFMSRRDADGRPLGELRAPETARIHVPMDMRTCPYPGSRNRHASPMNVSALRQMRDHWSEVRDGVSELRTAFLARHPRKGLLIHDLYQIIRTGALLPGYLGRRAEAPLADGHVPSAIAAISKILAGYFGVLYKLGVDSALEEGESLPKASSDEIIAFAEANQMFIGMDQVCAGPENMVREILDVIAEGGGSRSIIRQVCDLDRAMDYAELVMQLEYTKAVLWVHAWSARERIAALLPPAREASPTPRSVGRDESLPSMGIRWTLDHLPESERTETHAELLTRVTRHFEVSIARTRQPPAAARELFAACDGRGPAVSSVVLEALTRGRRASGKLPAQAVERIAEDLAQYLSVERSAITTINDLRAEINVALGVDAEPTPIGEADITKIFGSTPRDLVSEAVAVAP